MNGPAKAGHVVRRLPAHIVATHLGQTPWTRPKKIGNSGIAAPVRVAAALFTTNRVSETLPRGACAATFPVTPFYKIRTVGWHTGILNVLVVI